VRRHGLGSWVAGGTVLAAALFALFAGEYAVGIVIIVLLLPGFLIL
jgi:hypothetical protein